MELEKYREKIDPVTGSGVKRGRVLARVSEILSSGHVTKKTGSFG